MGGYKAIVTFVIVEDKEEAMKSMQDLLLKHFNKVRSWSEEEWCQTHKTWVECYGLTLHAWSNENIKKVVEV